ncbi:MAG: MBL fold metallo-hydrolase [candidate division KSB1 bacterium]|nr:MBL fold metallo-hydrolase [candidate division KSB1 bacterium]MDZ7346980.1 MBL fold metallo-hydrolase [candidate division KSB1 bacterium]
MFLFDERGIKLEGVDFWLDAQRATPFSFVSHGHSDHLKNHAQILATPPTILFHALRARQKKAVALDYHRPYFVGDLKIELYPSGHVLGAAMIRIERNGRSLLYTGDFKIKAGLTAEPIVIPRADILIMESTFGHPAFTFSEEGDPKAQLLDFIEECIRKKTTPVVMAYGLGKAQEAMKLLGSAGYDVRVHHDAWRIARIYEQFGISFEGCSLWRHEPLNGRQVLIIPPHAVRFRRAAGLPVKRRTVLLSGWAKSPLGNRFGADHCIPLSDHADFNELIFFVRQVQPQKIYTLHGFEDFPLYLRDLGYDAEYLS